MRGARSLAAPSTFPSASVPPGSGPGHRGEEAIRRYFVSGAYERDVKRVIEHVERLIAVRTRERAAQRTFPHAQQRRPRPMAIVWDIDETLLSTIEHVRSRFMRLHGESVGAAGPPPDRRHRAHPVDEYFPPIPGMVELYNATLSMGVRGILLTGRYDGREARALAEDNLRWAGVRTWDRLIMRGPDERKMNASEYKLHRRAALAEGYDILASVGDQPSDMSGSHCGFKVLMPNSAYKID